MIQQQQLPNAGTPVQTPEQRSYFTSPKPYQQHPEQITQYQIQTPGVPMQLSQLSISETRRPLEEKRGFLNQISTLRRDSSYSQNESSRSRNSLTFNKQVSMNHADDQNTKFVLTVSDDMSKQEMLENIQKQLNEISNQNIIINKLQESQISNNMNRSYNEVIKQQKEISQQKQQEAQIPLDKNRSFFDNSFQQYSSIQPSLSQQQQIQYPENVGIPAPTHSPIVKQTNNIQSNNRYNEIDSKQSTVIRKEDLKTNIEEKEKNTKSEIIDPIYYSSPDLPIINKNNSYLQDNSKEKDKNIDEVKQYKKEKGIDAETQVSSRVMNKNIDLHYNTVFERTASSNNALHLPLTDNTKHDDFSGTHAPGFLTQDIVPPSMRSNASDQVTLRSHPNQQTSQLYPSTSNVYQAQEVSQSRHKRPHQQRNTSTHHSPKHSHQTPKHKHHRTRHHSPHNTANNQLNNSTLHSTDSSSSNVYARDQQLLSDRERYQIKLERTFGEYTFPPQSDKDILNTITSIMSNGKGRMDIIVEEQIIEDGVDLKQLSDLGIINNSSSDDEYGTKLDNQWKSSEKDLNQSDLLLQFKETFKPNQFNVHRDVRVYQQGHMSPNHQQILYDSKGRQVPTGFKFQTDDREISTSQSPERRHNNHHSPSNNKTQTIKNRTPDASNSLRSDGNQSINRISPQRLNYTPQYNSSPPKNKYYQKNETDNEKK